MNNSNMNNNININDSNNNSTNNFTFKNLESEIRKMWNTEVFTVPAIVEALGLIRTGKEQNIR